MSKTPRKMRFFPLDAPAVDITDDGEIPVARPAGSDSHRFAPRSGRRQQRRAAAHEPTSDRDDSQGAG